MRAVFDTLGFLIGAYCCISKYMRNDTSVQYQFMEGTLWINEPYSIYASFSLTTRVGQVKKIGRY